MVALGSFARVTLCPASDIDVLLLHDGGWGDKQLAGLVQSVCYPLWDAGLSVGHTVLTAREAVAGSAEAIDRATSLTERRLVAGDPGLMDDLAARTDRWLRRNRSRLITALAEADAVRHGRVGPEPGMLEPDLKNGAGGLRDLDSLRWAAAFLLGEPTYAALIGARYLGAAEQRQLHEAGRTLHEVRCALHLVLGAAKPMHGVDVLRLDVQDEVADRLGLDSGDDVLRRVGLASRLVRYVHDRTWRQLQGDARFGRGGRRRSRIRIGSDLALENGVIEIASGAVVATDPALPLRAVAAAAANDTHIGRASAERLRRQVTDAGSLEWNDAGRAALLATLRRGRAGLASLADADHLGVLEAMLPEWPQVRGHPQRNPYHRFDLDTHLVRSVAELVDIAGGVLDPRHVVIAERIRAPEVVLLATVLHDVGKPWAGDHSVVGAVRAVDWVRHMGFGAWCAARVARLVRHHLLLPEVATSRDLDDPEELRRVANLVADLETLDGLYLLSLADARATGPSAYSAWKDNLLAELHARVQVLLTGGSEGWDRLAGPGVVAADARELVGDAEVDAVLDGTHRRYLRAATAEQVAAHARLLMHEEDGHFAPTSNDLRASWRSGPAPGTAVVSIVARDRRGLVADCAGVLAGHGLPVHEARAFTRDDGVALDWFVVGSRDRVTGSKVRPAAVIGALQQLAAATSVRREVDALVTRRERRRDERITGPSPAVEVAITPSAPIARIEVRGPDAPGMLYRLACVIADADLDIVGARVATLEGEVRDIFFVTSADPGVSSVDERLDGLDTALRVAADIPRQDPTEPRPPSCA